MKKVRISDVSQLLLAHSAESAFCFDHKNGQLLEKNTILSNDIHRYIPVPLLAEAQTIAICWDYIEEIDDVEIRHELRAILRHSDEDYEFPEFTEALYYHGLEEEWETYKEERLQHILADWCEHHDIEYRN